MRFLPLPLHFSFSFYLSFVLLLFILLIPSWVIAEENHSDDSEVMKIVETTEQTPIAQPHRIISLAPHITEQLFSAGAGKYIVGVVEYSDFPKQAKKIPIIGRHDSLNIEKIIELNPTIVVAWHNKSFSKPIQQLQLFGIPVIYSDAQNFEDIAAQIKRFGKRFNTEEIANNNHANLMKIIKNTKLKYVDKPSVAYFYQVWDKPIYTINGAQFISKGLETCQGKNIFHDEKILAPQVNIESILSLKPDVFILGGNAEKQTIWQAFWKQYPFLQAVKSNRFILPQVDEIQRPTERFIRALPKLCHDLHNR